MTLDEAIERYTSNAEYERTHGSLQGCMDFKQLAEWLTDYKRLKEQEPCENAISKRAVLDTLDSMDKVLDEDRTVENYKELLKECYEVLTPVMPQPKMGRWIIIDDCEQFIAKCSECGRIEDSRMISKHPYCHCGARMQEEEG